MNYVVAHSNRYTHVVIRRLVVLTLVAVLACITGIAVTLIFIVVIFASTMLAWI